MNTELDLVSIIITCYNKERFIAEAIESALYQTYKNKEIIVVDDGSTDNSLSIILDYKDRVNVVQQNNYGASSSRNTGVRVAKGKYVVFLDGDDILSKDSVARRVDIFQKDPHIGIVISPFYLFNESQVFLIVSDHWLENCKDQFNGIVQNGGLGSAGIAYLKEAFLYRGYFDPFLTVAEDTEQILKVASKYRVGFDFMPQNFLRRYHIESLAVDNVRMYRYLRKTYQKSSILSHKPLKYFVASRKGCIQFTRGILKSYRSEKSLWSYLALVVVYFTENPLIAPYAIQKTFKRFCMSLFTKSNEIIDLGEPIEVPQFTALKNR
jgi:glycosyltransferase involved in cell wall biosynthesis